MLRYFVGWGETRVEAAEMHHKHLYICCLSLWWSTVSKVTQSVSDTLVWRTFTSSGCFYSCLTPPQRTSSSTRSSTRLLPSRTLRLLSTELISHLNVNVPAGKLKLCSCIYVILLGLAGGSRADVSTSNYITVSPCSRSCEQHHRPQWCFMEHAKLDAIQLEPEGP